LFAKLPRHLFHLEKRTKYTTNSNDSITRVKSVHDTLKMIHPICAKIGITRIANITFLDRLYIPNYSAVLPGTDDTFWVYNGKGLTESSAKASALMEAIERFSALAATQPKNFIRGSHLALSKSNKVLHPNEVVEPVSEDYDEEHSILDYLPGFDLLQNETVLVPAELVLYRYTPNRPAVSGFLHSHTNGLASGNVVEEAICHALCEVIERDAASMADLCASAIPYNILTSVADSFGRERIYCLNSHFSIEDSFVDDPSIFPDVDITELCRELILIKPLVKRFIDSGIPLLIKDITQKDMGIPSFVASSIEWLTRDYGLLAKGFGTHPDARVALVRAITELSQTRAVNIHGARDDLIKVQYKLEDDIYRRKWQFMPASSLVPLFSDRAKTLIRFSEVKTCYNVDILDDIHLILTSLKKAGIKKVIIINLTNPNIGIPVVRAIVPGLETFEVQNSVMGRRAKCFWRQHFT
jgi:ribosomal protein S12 methylthiotransferase accessory factor YcaO